MRKVIGIYYKANFNESSFETGCGGSDTWVIQIAKEFVRHNYHIVVFSEYDSWEITNSGVEYVPIDVFQMRCGYQHFDYFIMTRLISPDVYDTIVNNGCKKIYLQSHDMFIWHYEMYQEKYIYDPERYPYLEYVALTKFHKEELHEYNRIPYEKIHIIGNGIDSNIFNYCDSKPVEKDNSILFPSVYGRGGDILMFHVAPIVRKSIPDFEVNICGYSSNLPHTVWEPTYSNVLGTLTKEQYYDEFRKHKVWFLPCVVPEDFGLCACEAVMCGCDIVSPFEDGMRDVCSPFVNLKMNNRFNVKDRNGEYHYSGFELDMRASEFKVSVTEAAERIVDTIQNYYNPDRVKLRQSFKNYILETHNWLNVVNKWIEVFK